MTNPTSKETDVSKSLVVKALEDSARIIRGFGLERASRTHYEAIPIARAESEVVKAARKQHADHASTEFYLVAGEGPIAACQCDICKSVRQLDEVSKK